MPTPEPPRSPTMFLFSRYRQLADKTRGFLHSDTPRRRNRWTCRPAFEVLEDRLTPSVTITVNNLSDTHVANEIRTFSRQVDHFRARRFALPSHPHRSPSRLSKRKVLDTYAPGPRGTTHV